MEFFDSKQEVIDIRLTQFGKNLLARGFFKPVYYQFFDDDILYNSEYAGFTETQNSAEERILETPRIKTQHVVIGIETSFDEEQERIESGSAEVFKQITKNQRPEAAQKLLKYTLEKNEINSQEAPRFKVGLSGPYVRSFKDSITIEDVELPIPQLNLTSSYTIIRDTRNKIAEVPQSVVDTEKYIDISSENLKFLDNSTITLKRQDITIDMDEFGVDLGLDNFEVEIFEVIEEEKTKDDGTKFIKENFLKLRDVSQIRKYFNIKTDEMVPGKYSNSRDGRSSPRGRGQKSRGGY
tara:strand:- start:2241 stop:3125 length:885 start_codon:yes stop_codon:yes gene_type:complete